MTYHFSKTVSRSMGAAVAQETQSLKQAGFGSVIEVDVQKTPKTKIEVDFRSYRSRGACNPGFARKALLAEDQSGVILPCNVVVQAKSFGSAAIVVVDPVASMQTIDNLALGGIANAVRLRLQRVIAQRCRNPGTNLISLGTFDAT